MNRKALVTGGTKGLGRAVAFRLARDGCEVTCVYKSDDANAKECAKTAESAHLNLRVLRADVSSAEDVGRLFGLLATTNFEADYLINAAGMVRDAALVFAKPKDFDEVLAVNLRSAFLMCQQCSKSMARRRFGRIVNFSSPAAVLGNEGQVAYSAAKAGILGLTRTLARELGRFQITVNAVSPGLVATGMIEQMSESKVAAIVARTPVGRLGTAEEVANAVRFLCDDLSGYITGQCIAVDGGLT